MSCSGQRRRSLNPHFHYHIVILDGLFAEDDDGSIRFHPASDLGSRDIQRLQQTLRRRTLRLFLRRGLLDETTVDNMLTWQAAGGFSLDASVRGSRRHPASAARSRWAQLLAHIYEVFPLICPDCGAEMRILAFLTAAPLSDLDAMLRRLHLPSVRRLYPDLALRAEAEGMSYRDFLEILICADITVTREALAASSRTQTESTSLATENPDSAGTQSGTYRNPLLLLMIASDASAKSTPHAPPVQAIRMNRGLCIPLNRRRG
jgi:hypothetical protein